MSHFKLQRRICLGCSTMENRVSQAHRPTKEVWDVDAASAHALLKCQHPLSASVHSPSIVTPGSDLHVDLFIPSMVK